MALRAKKEEEDVREKVLDVNASMQGTLTFKDPVNLRINGNFEGSLDTKGSLTIGENASVKAKITGESIVIAGKVNGDIVAERELKLMSTAHMLGDVKTPIISIMEGAIFQGNCKMIFEDRKTSVNQNNLTVEELAKYLEVEVSSILEWVNNNKIPAQRAGNTWRFDKAKVDEWIVNEKIK